MFAPDPPILARRQCLFAIPAALGVVHAIHAEVGTAGTARVAGEPTSPAVPGDAFPSHDPAAVRDIVGASHGRLDRVRELLAGAPELAKAAWDWGFGDWETALGAASHVGNREIAELLITNGARPDLFTFAMLGNLDAVRAIVSAAPGIERLKGPHGLTLAHHARQGGDVAKPVVEYLAALPGADETVTSVPLDDARRAALCGIYAFGPSASQRLEVFTPPNRRQPELSIRRGEGAPRGLTHLGEAVFQPAGAPNVRIAFRFDGDRVTQLAITAPGPVAVAQRL